jgi:antiviral defense system Shedu protein SduA
MKEFVTIHYDPAQCRQELDRFQALLASKQELSERADLQPLFKNSPQLTAFLATSFPKMAPANRLAYEFDIFGDFTADIVVGNFEHKTYCAIELEDARPTSIFNKLDGRATKEWGRRFEHGFGQLVDWFYTFDDHKNSAGFTKHFGYGHIEFFGLLLIGRSADLTEYDSARLHWRSDRVTVNTHKIYCRTYDHLSNDLNRDWRLSAQTGPNESGG